MQAEASQGVNMEPNTSIDATSVTNSADQERLCYINAMVQASEKINVLKKRITILMEVLTGQQEQEYAERCNEAGLLPEV